NEGFCAANAIEGHAMSDDPGLVTTNNPALPNYVSVGTPSPLALAFQNNVDKAISEGRLQVGQSIGPGGRSQQGYAYSWLPYDPRQQLFDSHQHWGPTYDDPIFGKLQAMYTEPSKHAHDFWEGGGLANTLFGTALGAITMGAAAPFLGPLFSAATQYGTKGKLDPLSLALSAAPGVLGGIDPALAQAYKVGTSAYG